MLQSFYLVLCGINHPYFQILSEENQLRRAHVKQMELKADIHPYLNHFIYRTWLTRQKMTAFLLISWLDAALVSVLPFFWRRGTEDEPCIYDPTREWSLMVIVTNVFTPFLIMLFCHIYTVTFALKYSRKRKLEILASGNNPTRPQYDWQPDAEARSKKSQKRERDVTRTLGLVVGAFVICWGPSTFYYFIQMVCPGCFTPGFQNVKPIFNAVVKLMTFLNSCVNPLIYYWLNRVLRHAFYRSIGGNGGRAREPRAKHVPEMAKEDSSGSQYPSRSRISWATKRRLLDTNEESDERTNSKIQTVV